MCSALARVAMTVGLIAGLMTPASARVTSEGRSEATTIAAAKVDELARQQREQLGIPDRFLPFLNDGARVRSGRELIGESAPDLDANGAPEVMEVDLRYSYAVGEGQQGLMPVQSDVNTRLTIRDGRNGRKLWAKRYATSAWPIPMRVGEGGRQGIVVISGIWNFYGTTEESTLRFDAYAGKTGKRLWSREYRAVSYYDMVTSVTEDAPIMIATFDALEGRPEDLMVALATQARTPLTTTTATRVVVIDGATGEEHLHPTVDIGVDWWPIPLPTRDLDGDGLDDYGTTNNLGADLGEGQDPPAVGGTVYTRRGTDGSSIWTTSGIEMEFYAYTLRLPDVISDNTPEVGLLTLVTRETPLLPVPIPLVGFRIQDRVYLFDGAFGQQRWHKKSEWMYSPGDIDRLGKPDLMLGRFRISFRKGKSTLEQFAVTGAGETLWKKRSVWRFDVPPCPQGACFGGYGYWLDAWSDVEPDGVRDVFFQQQIQQNAAFNDSVARVYNGRDGTLRFQEDGVLQPAWVAIDGRGSDFVHYDYQGSRALVTARDGRNHDLWRVALVGEEKIIVRRSGIWSQGIRLPGDRCADLIVNWSYDDASSYFVVDGGNGRKHWSRTTLPAGRRPRLIPQEDRNPAC